MKFAIINILFFLFFFSCSPKTPQEEKLISVDEIKIPTIEIHKKDAHFTLKNGILYFDEKPYSGVVKEVYDDNNIKSKSEYYQGKRQGYFLGWYKDGQQWFQRTYTNGLKSGIHTGWYNNGTQMFEYHFNDKGAYHGAVKDWFPSGILAKHFNFVNGKETGAQKMWDLKGKIRANFYTVNAERHGLIGLKKCESVLSK